MSDLRPPQSLPSGSRWHVPSSQKSHRSQDTTGAGVFWVSIVNEGNAPTTSRAPQVAGLNEEAPEGPHQGVPPPLSCLVYTSMRALRALPSLSRWQHSLI